MCCVTFALLPRRRRRRHSSRVESTVDYIALHRIACGSNIIINNLILRLLQLSYRWSFDDRWPSSAAAAAAAAHEM